MVLHGDFFVTLGVQAVELRAEDRIDGADACPGAVVEGDVGAEVVFFTV